MDAATRAEARVKVRGGRLPQHPEFPKVFSRVPSRNSRKETDAPQDTADTPHTHTRASFPLARDLRVSSGRCGATCGSRRAVRADVLLLRPWLQCRLLRCLGPFLGRQCSCSWLRWEPALALSLLPCCARGPPFLRSTALRGCRSVHFPRRARRSYYWHHHVPVLQYLQVSFCACRCCRTFLT